MNCTLKVLGLALVAVFAMFALLATAAGAEQWHAGEHGTVKGENIGEELFVFNAGSVRCVSTIYNGSLATSTVSSQNAKPTYAGCTAFGFINTTIDTGSCEFRFNTPVNTTSFVDIVNCGVTKITVTGFNCWVTIGNQNGLSHVLWSNQSNSPHDIHSLITVTGIIYTQHKKSFPGCEEGTFNNGTYTGTTTWRAFNTSGKQVPLTVT